MTTENTYRGSSVIGNIAHNVSKSSSARGERCEGEGGDQDSRTCHKSGPNY